MDGKIFNSQGVHVAIVRGQNILSLSGEKLFDLRGVKIYKTTGELVGHLANASAADRLVSTRRPTSYFQSRDLAAFCRDRGEVDQGASCPLL
jgi:hypothetical protein